MTSLFELLNNVSKLEAGILTVLFLSLSYFFLRSGQQSAAKQTPVASSVPPDVSPPIRPPDKPVPSPAIAPVPTRQLIPAKPALPPSLQTTSVGSATREFMELLARMGDGANNAESSTSQEHWQTAPSQRA